MPITLKTMMLKFDECLEDDHAECRSDVEFLESEDLEPMSWMAPLRCLCTCTCHRPTMKEFDLRQQYGN
jgi:hypothetical protein